MKTNPGAHCSRVPKIHIMNQGMPRVSFKRYYKSNKMKKLNPWCEETENSNRESKKAHLDRMLIAGLNLQTAGRNVSE